MQGLQLTELKVQPTYINTKSIKISDEGRSPVVLFMALNESEIARQLTLIEFKMFVKIRPSELLNQAWNKTDLQNRGTYEFMEISHFLSTQYISYDIACQ